MVNSNRLIESSDIEFAREIIQELEINPLVIDVLNDIKKYREVGIPPQKIKTVVIDSYTVKNSDYQTPEQEERAIIVENMPWKYNKIDWQ